MKFVKENKKNWKLKSYSLEGHKRYADYDGYYGKAVKDEENFVFDATLKLDGTYRGPSAAGFNFVTENGTELIMRLNKTSELLEAIVSGKVKVVKQGFKGRFTFFKQGSNYSIGVYDEK